MLFYHDVYGMYYCFIVGGGGVGHEQKENISFRKNSGQYGQPLRVFEVLIAATMSTLT